MKSTDLLEPRGVFSQKHPWMMASLLRWKIRAAFGWYKNKLMPLATIQTHMYENEKLLLFWLARGLDMSANVVEIGSYLGASASYLSEGLNAGKGGTCYCVDTWHNDAMNEENRDTYLEFCRNTKMYQGTIVPLRGESRDVADRYPGGPVSLLFIDGDHTYDGCNTDWSCWRRYLSDSCIVAFHDYTRSDGIRRVVEEMVPQTHIVEFMYSESSLLVLWLRERLPANSSQY